ncbi:hypothetical protein [Metabacillus idriensis]|nr:hypothetical protein [Metabacillus idriensis]
MIKKGRYALYNGKEYSIIQVNNGQVKLRSMDSSVLNEVEQVLQVFM